MPSRSTLFHALPLALALACAHYAPPAAATTAVAYSLQQQVDAAELIVRGVVLDVWTEIDGNGHVWTKAMVEVSEALKGGERQTVILSDPGGVHGSTRMHVGGSTPFSVGEDVVVFGSVRGQDRVQLVGLSQGKFTVRFDPATRREVVQRWAPPAGLPYDHRFIPPPKDGEQLFLDDLLADIRARLAEGWDGQPIPGVPTERLYRVNRLQPGVK